MYISKKIIIGFILIIGVILGFCSTSIIDSYEGKTIKVNTINYFNMKDSLNTFTHKENTQTHMANALQICFNLSSYEARYYAIMFYDISMKNKIRDWEIFPAVMYVESRFIPDLRSDKDALGVMQLLEPTAMEQAKNLDIPYGRKTRINLILNTVIGCSYLAEGIKKFGLSDGAKYYIAGPKYNDPSRIKCKPIITEYHKDVMLKYFELKNEYQKLRYVYQGISMEVDSLKIELK